MLHYSNASSIEKNRRYLVIKVGACLVALARERGRQLRSRTGHQQRRQPRSLPERRGGRNNKYNAHKASQNIMRQYTVLGMPNAVRGGTGEGGKHPGKYPRCFAFSGRGAGGVKLRVWYVRGVWRRNGLRIRVRLVVLSNFHVENNLIWVTD